MIPRNLGPLLGLLAAALTAQAPAPPPLTLQQAEQIALQNHPQLRAAQLDANALQQDTRVVKSAAYPLAAANLTGAEAENGTRIAAGLLNNPSVYSRYANGVAVSQLLTDFGRTSNLVQSAQLHAQAGASDVAATRQDVLAGVASAFFGLLRAQALLRVADQTVAERQVVVNQVTALTQAQLRSGLDQSFAQVNLSSAQVDRLDAQSQVQSAQAQLGAALGLPGPAVYTLTEPPLPSAPPADVQALLDQALAQRPELAGLRLEQQSAAHFASAEADLSRPTVTALGAAGLVPAGEAPLETRYAAVAANVSIPIFNGYAFSARHQAAELRSQAADQQLRQAQDAILRDVRLAWLQAQNAYQQLDLTRQLLEQSQRSLDLARQRYQLGLDTIVALNQAQLNQTQALIRHTAAAYDFQAATATLQFQLGATP